MADLKPCPVCHGKMMITKVSESYGMDGSFKDWIVSCAECLYSYRIPADSFYGRAYCETANDAIQHFNKKLDVWEKRRADNDNRSK